MTARRTLTDDGLKAILVITLIVSVFVAGVFFASGGPSVRNLLGFAVIGGLTLLTILVVLLIGSFVKYHRVTCDLTGCEVITSNKWKNFESKRFSWSEVTDTSFVSRKHHNFKTGEYSSHHFFVSVNDSEIELMYKGRQRDFNELIATVNKMTPHLPYVWVERKDINNRRTLEDMGQSHVKVVRD